MCIVNGFLSSDNYSFTIHYKNRQNCSNGDSIFKVFYPRYFLFVSVISLYFLEYRSYAFQSLHISSRSFFLLKKSKKKKCSSPFQNQQ